MPFTVKSSNDYYNEIDTFYCIYNRHKTDNLCYIQKFDRARRLSCDKSFVSARKPPFEDILKYNDTTVFKEVYYLRIVIVNTI